VRKQFAEKIQKKIGKKSRAPSSEGVVENPENGPKLGLETSIRKRGRDDEEKKRTTDLAKPEKGTEKADIRRVSQRNQNKGKKTGDVGLRDYTSPEKKGAVQGSESGGGREGKKCFENVNKKKKASGGRHSNVNLTASKNGKGKKKIKTSTIGTLPFKKKNGRIMGDRPNLPVN